MKLALKIRCPHLALKNISLLDSLYKFLFSLGVNSFEQSNKKKDQMKYKHMIETPNENIQVFIVNFSLNECICVCVKYNKIRKTLTLTA